MWEGNNVNSYQANPTSATTSAVTFSNLTAAPEASYMGDEVVIIAGTGIGEVGWISGDNRTTRRISVNPPLRIAPDTTSVVQLQMGVSNVGIWNNNLTGKSYAAAGNAI